MYSNRHSHTHTHTQSHAYTHTGAVLGTGDPGSRPGRHFFIKRGGRQEHFKKKNHLGHEAVFYYLSYHCVWNWQIGAPCSCRRLCSLRRCRGQILSEKGEGGRGEGAGYSSPLGLFLPNNAHS